MAADNMARVGPLGRAMIERFEGRRLSAYLDGCGVWTIGYGSTGPDIIAGTVWTPAQCDARFAAQLEQFADQVTALLDDAATSPAQFDALVSFAYNAGSGNLANSRILSYHKAGQFGQAAFAWLTCHIHDRAGNIEAGLVARRKAESAFYMGAPA